MCLAVPMQINKISGNLAEAGIGDVKRTIRLDIIDDRPDIGDYVIVHAGFAIHLIQEAEARETIGYIEEALSDGYDIS